MEGYYAEDAELTEWFRLIRALQAVDVKRRVEVSALPAYQRLLAVTSAPLYGQPQHHGLLPVGQDPLSHALLDTDMKQWNPRQLAVAACAAAHRADDCSLVGLAARARDPVLIAALRESVVLYAEVVLIGLFEGVPRREFVWRVDEDVARHAMRFVNAFNELFGEELPPPDPDTPSTTGVRASMTGSWGDALVSPRIRQGVTITGGSIVGRTEH